MAAKSTIFEEKLIRLTRARRKLKSLVRSVSKNIFWLEEGQQHDELSDSVAKNIKMIMSPKKKYHPSPLSRAAKAILNIPRNQRTEEEKAFLHRAIGGLKCFRKYPREVRKELSSVTGFAYYGAGRMVVRQNDVGRALYFILSGCVEVSTESYNEILERNVTTIIGTMCAGDMFGEVSLLHGTPRRATVTTATPCEFCVLKRVDFNSVLKETVQAFWDEIRKFMSYFSYFQSWDEMTKTEACVLGKIFHYQYDEIILGDGIGSHSCVYFIIEGKVDVVEFLPLQVRCRNGYKVYKLYDLPNRDTSNEGVKNYELPADVEAHFFRIATLRRLATFNVGERMERRSVLAKASKVTCLLIPQYWLFQKNTGDIWTKVATFLDRHLPSSKDLLKYFTENKKWSDYKKKLMMDILAQSNRSNTNSISNVPYSIRMAEDVEFYYHK